MTVTRHAPEVEFRYIELFSILLLPRVLVRRARGGKVARDRAAGFMRLCQRRRKRETAA